jgi:hypothetical protein
MEKVKKTDTGCWIWAGANNGRGYGQFWDGERNIPAHWFLLPRRPDTSKGQEACHTCDNRACVNPDHVFVGSRSDNMADCSSKGRLRYQNGLLAAKGMRKIWHAGEDNPAAKLTAEQAAEAALCPRKYGSAIALARRFGVSSTVICGIRDGHRWKRTMAKTETGG